MNTDWRLLTPELQKILDEATGSGEECGCQLVIYHHGIRAVNLVSGCFGPNRQKVTPDTLFPIYSCGKAVMATTVHRLVQKGILSYDMKVSDVWPEFACNGKEDIRLWHLLTHRSGLQQLPPSTYDEQADWELMCARLAAATPAWKPGTKCAYHGLTFAWLVGETAARAAKTDFCTLVTREVLEPLSLQKAFFFGTTAEADARLAEIDVSAMGGPCWVSDFIENDNIRHGLVPSANGVSTADALARHYAALVSPVDGVRLLAPESVQNATILRRDASDPIPPEGTWAKFGLGYALCGPPEDFGAVFGHGGAAGSEGFAIPGEELALGFTKNRPLPTHPFHPVRTRISQALGMPPWDW